MDFSRKTIVVTGAGGGLGRAIAVGLSNDGARVIGFGRHADSLAETRDLCAPGRMSFVAGNVSDEADVDSLFTEASRVCGGVDILVNNAAVYPKRAFLEMPFAEWRAAIDTNLTGVALCCHRALPGMLERGFGRIVNVGTFAWLGPIPFSSAYSASKGAIRPFTRALASEIDSALYPDVLVNEFIPGQFVTGMSDHGKEPGTVYPYLRFVIEQPAGGPTGQTFFKSELLQDAPELRRRVKLALSRLSFGLYKPE